MCDKGWAKRFREAEASFLLEGLDAGENSAYQAMKARIISGEIDIDDAIQLRLEHYKSLQQAAVSEFADSK